MADLINNVLVVFFLSFFVVVFNRLSNGMAFMKEQVSSFN